MSRRPTKADLEQRIRELEQENRAIKDAARQSGERYQSLFTHSMELFFIHDFEGRFLEANEKALEQFGYTRDEIPGLNLASVVCPEDQPKAVRLLQELHETGSQEYQKPTEYRLRTKDGRIIWVEASSSIIFRDGIPHAVQGIARDITERKLAEESLRLSEEKHRRVLENIEEGYYELDLQGNITYCNNVARIMLGYEPSELAGMSYRNYTSPDTARSMYEVFHRIFETGNPERLVDYEVIFKDGSIRTHEMSAGLMRDATGRPSGFHVLVHDITTRKQAQDRLKESEERYRTIFENTGNATILIAEDTTIKLANSKFEKLTGYTKEEMEGQMSWTVFIVPEDLERMKRYHAQRRKEPESTPGSYEFRMTNRAGDVRDIFLTVALIPGTTESVASCMDITERKRAEEELRRSEERYRSMLQSMEEAYYEVDLKGNFTFFNIPAVKRLGYTEDELRGMNFREYIDAENAQKVFNAYHQVFLTGEPIASVDWELASKAGEKIYVDASVSLMHDAAGNPIGFRGVVRDITERKKAEDALKASEEKYRGILESMQESYFEVDLSGNFTFFNDAAIQMSGYPREELLGMNYTRYSPPDTARYMLETFHDVYVTGMPKRMVDYRVFHKDGSLHDNELSVWPMRDATGAIVGFHTLVRDVTERKLAEKAMREREAKYRFLTEKMNDVVWTMDLDLKTTYVSPSVFKVLGFTPEERMVQSPQDQMAPESYARALEVLSYELERDGQHGVDPERTITFEAEYYHKDGSHVWMENRISGIRDGQGRPVGLHGVSRDITEGRKAAQALRESEEKYRTILETMDEAYFELDLKGNYTFVNESQGRILGYPREKLLGLNNRAYTTPETARRAYVEFNEVYRTGMPKTLTDYEVIKKDGTRVIVEFSVSPLRDNDGEIVGFRGVGRDVTDRIKAEKALKESERKYRLLAENLRDVIWVLDADLKYVYVSPSVMQLRGYTPEEAMRQKMDEVLAPESYQMAVELFTQEKVLELSGQRHGREWTRNLDLEMIRKDGSRVWTEVTLNILYDENGSPEGLLGITHDISERRKAAESLRESEERWQFALEGAGDGVWDYDVTSGRVYRSRRWKEMLGYAEDEISSRPAEWARLVHPEDMERSNEVLESHLRGETPVYVSEHRIRCRDGLYKWILDRGKVVAWSEDGRPLRIIGTQSDITERKQAEEALRESEERYRTLFDGMLDGVYRSTHDGRFVDINQAMVEMFGYASREEMMQADIRTELYFAPEDRESQALVDRETGKEIHCMRRKDGTAIWVEDHARYVYDDQGNILFHEGTLRDVTDRKLAEEAIQKSEERYRTIFESTATANMLIAEDTTVLLVNSNFEKLTGYSRHEVENKMSWTQFVVQEDLARMIEHHKTRRVDAGAAPSAYEFRGIIRSGEIRNLFMSVAMIPGTKDSVSSLIDMTDRKKAEDALRQSEERFRDLARLLPETVFEADTNGMFTFVNDISLERFGYTRDEMDRGLNVLAVMAPEDHERVIANYQRVMAGERLGLNEYTARKKDGTTFPVLVHTTPIYRDGTPAGLRGFLVDISEKKALEDQLMRAQKMEAIGTLAGGIAHDFNNLLMGILGNVSLLRMHFDEGHPFHDRLKSMEEYVQRGSDLTKQLLGFARGGKYEVKPTDLGEFVRRSAEMFGRTKKEIRIHHKAADGLWTVEVDRGQMEQVLLNLFVNAWQAMPGGGDMYLSVENAKLEEEQVSPYHLKEGRYIKLTVTDTGVGMDEATKERIFEPFFSTKERGRGTGLGLASVYGIVKNHGGFVTVESEKDIGTSFMIYLPASDKGVQDEARTEGEIHKGRETVLLIDDEEMIVEVGARMLEGLGYRVLTAGGGRQGLKIFDQEKGAVDLVILDMIMPDFGGKETFEALLRQSPSVKVLLSSGYSLDGQAKEIMERGCRGFIQKPFTMADLSRKIREILEEK